MAKLMVVKPTYNQKFDVCTSFFDVIYLLFLFLGADVLNQLARMKAQLQSESKRVEQDLRKQEVEPEVYDSRLYQKPITPA